MTLFRSINGKVTEAPDVVKRKASVSDRLVEAFQSLDANEYQLKMESDYVPTWRDNFYLRIAEKIIGIEYTPSDLQELVLTLSKHDDDFKEMKGAYVGGLVSLFTEKHKDERVEMIFDL